MADDQTSSHLVRLRSLLAMPVADLSTDALNELNQALGRDIDRARDLRRTIQNDLRRRMGLEPAGAPAATIDLPAVGLSTDAPAI